jgi:hypothetical protein
MRLSELIFQDEDGNDLWQIFMMTQCATEN